MTAQQIIPFLAVGAALLLILFRNRRPRTLRPQWMWVTPVVILPLMGLALWGTSRTPGAAHAAFHVADWTVMGLGLIFGGIAGWWRGKMTTIEKHADGSLKAQASPLGIILIFVLLLGRRALAAVVEPHAAALHLTPVTITDALVLFVIGTILVQRLEMYLRARRIQHGGGDDHVEAVA